MSPGLGQVCQNELALDVMFIIPSTSRGREARFSFYAKEDLSLYAVKSVRKPPMGQREDS